MNRRERTMLIVAIVMLGVIVFKYLIYDPEQAEYATLVTARDAAAAEYTRDQQVLARAEASRREYDRVRSHIASVEQKMPQTKEVPALLVAMETFTKQVGVTFEAIRPGTLTQVSSAASPAPQSRTPGTAAAAAGKPLSYSEMSVDLSLEGTFGQLVEYLRGLRNFPRLVIVDSVSVTPVSFPRLGVTVRASIYTLGAPSGKTEGSH